jgi:hypothetical protein
MRTTRPLVTDWRTLRALAKRQKTLAVVSARAPPEAANLLATMKVVFRNDETPIQGEAMIVEQEDRSRMVETGKGPSALPKIAVVATGMHQEIGTMGTRLVHSTCRMSRFADLDKSRRRRRCTDMTIALSLATRTCRHPVTTTMALTIRWMTRIVIGPRLPILRNIPTLWTTDKTIETGIGIAEIVARIVTALQVQRMIVAVVRSVKIHVVAVTKKVFEV